jgi:hypothetical protein
MKKLGVLLITLLVVSTLAFIRPAKAQDTVGGGADPIVTTVDAHGLITVTHVFANGHTQVLASTHSITAAQAAWLDGTHQLALESQQK